MRSFPIFLSKNEKKDCIALKRGLKMMFLSIVAVSPTNSHPLADFPDPFLCPAELKSTTKFDVN